MEPILTVQLDSSVKVASNLVNLEFFVFFVVLLYIYWKKGQFNGFYVYTFRVV